jgi:membrane associated rhomboid family serine protease
MGLDGSPSVPDGGEAPVSAAVAARQRGLRLVTRINRWMIGLAVLLAGALTGVAAHAFHPKTASAQTVAPAAGQSSNPAGAAGAAAGATGASSAPLQPPAAAPAPAVSAPAPAPVAPVVSGGS